MRIACPACNAAYQVPDTQMTEGRIVRCARCATDWAPIVAAPDTPGEPERRLAADLEPLPGPASEPTIKVEPLPAVASELPLQPASEPASTGGTVPVPTALSRTMAVEDGDLAVQAASPLVKTPRRGLPLLPIAWVASLALVLGAIGYLVVERQRVMALWPPTVRGYVALGLAPRT